MMPTPNPNPPFTAGFDHRRGDAALLRNDRTSSLETSLADDESRDRTLIEILRGGEGNLGEKRGQGLADPTPPWLKRIDEWATRMGDRLNPILVKETRQALKSRQFLTTFSMLLLAALSWTVICSLQGMPAIYYLPWAPQLLVGYYVLLAVPMLLVVPLAAYRSLESEVDEGTLDLLSVTALSPRQIITGKLASAALQMGLYLVVLFPCVAYAYTLRGIDLPTLALLMAGLIVIGLGLTTVALFFAPVTGGRTGQVTSLIVVMTLLLGVQVILGREAIDMIRFGNPLRLQDTLVLAGCFLLAGGTLCHLLLTASAIRLTPESENRSTAIRVAALIHLLAMIAAAAMLMRWFRDGGELVEIGIPTLLAAYLSVFWGLVGSMMSSESPVLTPRVRRELPATFAERMFLTWFTPGPATGLVFACVLMVLSMAAAWGMMVEASPGGSASKLTGPKTAMILSCAYLTVGFLGVRLIISFLRTRNTFNVTVGIAALAVTYMLMILVPYGVGAYLNDFRRFDYSAWQASNWIWTMRIAAFGNLDPKVMYIVSGFAIFGFLVHLLLTGPRVLPQRWETPKEVEEEYRRLAGETADEAKEIDPLGLATEGGDA